MKITLTGSRLPTVTDSAILGFFGDYRFLSNFHLVDIPMFGFIYPSTENAYMAAKTLSEEERERFVYLDPPVARKLGQLVKLRKDWEVVKIDYMYQANVEKYKDAELREKLLATGNLYLEETNNWGDTFWGVCEGKGKNHLGLTLMKIREEIRQGRI